MDIRKMMQQVREEMRREKEGGKEGGKPGPSSGSGGSSGSSPAPNTFGVRFEGTGATPKVKGEAGSGDAYPMDSLLGKNLSFGVGNVIYGRTKMDAITKTIADTPASLVDYGRSGKQYTQGRYSTGGTMGSGSFTTISGQVGLSLPEAHIVQESLGFATDHTIASSQEHGAVKDAFGQAIEEKARRIKTAYEADPSSTPSVRLVKRPKGG